MSTNSCRFCGINSENFVSIFEGYGSEQDLEKKIARHLPVHVLKDDLLPQQVCVPCADKLNHWDNFVTLCLNTDANFRTKIKDNELYDTKNDVELFAGFSSDDEPLITIKSKTQPSEDKGPKPTKPSYACDNCQKCFQNKGLIRKHVVRCMNENKFVCQVCGKIYKSKKFHQRHQKVHKEKESKLKNECNICGQSFESRKQRSQHKRDIHNKEQIKCDFCDMTGPRISVYRHMRVAHARKQFKCELCPLKFTTFYRLKIHGLSHSDKRCFTCDVCGMGFKRLQNVRDHMRCHQEKSNQCQVCGKSFVRKRYMVVHLKTIHHMTEDGEQHVADKGFECNVCGAKLKWKQNLLAHMRIHTGEKPYQCKICQQSFYCHSSLRSHKSKHEVCPPNEQVDIRVLSCQVNPSIFQDQPNDVKAHIKLEFDTEHPLTYSALPLKMLH